MKEIINTRKVWVNPVPRVSAQGRHRQTYQTVGENGVVTTTVNMQKTKEFGTSSVYFFPYNKNTDRLFTGLDVTITNPFYNSDISEIKNKYNVHPDFELGKIVTQKEISKQLFYEIKHGVEPGKYNSFANNNWFTGDPSAKNSSYLAEFSITLYPRPNVFTTTTPRQELAIILIDALVEAGRIAESKSDANSALHEFYISENNQEETVMSNIIEKREEAIAKLYEIKTKYPKFALKEIAAVLPNNKGKYVALGDTTQEQLKIAISNYLKDDFNVNKFLEVVSLLETPEGAEKIKVMYCINQAVHKGVINSRQGEYIWVSKTGDQTAYNLGSRYDNVINFFLKEYKNYNPESEDLNYYSELVKELTVKGVEFK